MVEEKESAFVKASADKKWNKEVSAGGVVYKKENGAIFVLLINPLSRNYGPPEDYWSFPKGHIDEGETKEDAAVREVEEETGIKAKIISDLSYIKFFRNYDKVLKFVHYFLMEFISGDTANHDKEVHDAKWVNIDEVDKMIKWPTDKEIFNKARSHLS